MPSNATPPKPGPEALTRMTQAVAEAMQAIWEAHRRLVARRENRIGRRIRRRIPDYLSLATSGVSMASQTCASVYRSMLTRLEVHGIAPHVIHFRPVPVQLASPTTRDIGAAIGRARAKLAAAIAALPQHLPEARQLTDIGAHLSAALDALPTPVTPASRRPSKKRRTAKRQRHGTSPHKTT